MTNHLASPVKKDCRIRIGLTEMLSEFLDLCSQSSSESFFLAAPFVDESLIEQIRSRFTREKIRFHIVVGDEALSARLQARLSRWPAAVVTIHVCPRLHAKVYVCETRRHDFVGLIGSQNPTQAGTTSNVEAGVLVHARSGSPEWWMLADLRAGLCERSHPCPRGI